MPEPLYLCKGECRTNLDAEWLLVTCFHPEDPQFSGILRVLREVRPGTEGRPGSERRPGTEGRPGSERRPGSEDRPGSGALSWIPWDGRPLAESGIRACHLVLSGHGTEDAALLGDNRGRHLQPASIARAVGTDLYLLCCYQGQDRLRRAWARGAGVAAAEVHGAEVETETLLTTLFLLHLCFRGTSAAPRLFDQWARCNSIIGPCLPEARERYRRAGGNPLPVLEFLDAVVDLSPVQDFLDLARQRPEYLTGIGA